jgi:hypothetical protein
MSNVAGITKALTLTGLAVATAAGPALVTLRLRRAWRNMKTIQSVDTGSVWTTK